MDLISGLLKNGFHLQYENLNTYASAKVVQLFRKYDTYDEALKFIRYHIEYLDGIEEAQLPIFMVALHSKPTQLEVDVPNESIKIRYEPRKVTPEQDTQLQAILKKVGLTNGN